MWFTLAEDSQCDLWKISTLPEIKAQYHTKLIKALKACINH